MIKGISRKMFVLKDTKSDIFEEAYFVIKEDIIEKNPTSDIDMVAEANRIIDENDVFIKEKFTEKKPSLAPFSAFMSGIFFAVAVIMTLYVIFV